MAQEVTKDQTLLLYAAPKNVIKAQTPLMAAAIDGLYNQVLALLEQGAEVNAINQDNYSALHFAVCYLHPKLVRLLLEHQANPNQISSTATGMVTPLHLAVGSTGDMRARREIIEILLRFGADMRAVDATGVTPKEKVQDLLLAGHEEATMLSAPFAGYCRVKP